MKTVEEESLGIGKQEEPGEQGRAARVCKDVRIKLILYAN